MRLNLQELGDLASPWELVQMHSYISYVHAEMGEFDHAWESYETALKVSKESGVKIMETTRTYDRALIAWLQGDREKIEESLEGLMNSMDELKEMNASYDLNDWQEMAARIYVALGDYENALKHTTEMLEVMEFVPRPRDPQIKHYTHAMALYGLGRHEEGDEYLNMARERVMSVAGNIKDDELRRGWLENVKINREILKVCAERGIAQ
jgi:tetratricopeptide (TPR) repeat protein